MVVLHSTSTAWWLTEAENWLAGKQTVFKSRWPLCNWYPKRSSVGCRWVTTAKGFTPTKADEQTDTVFDSDRAFPNMHSRHSVYFVFSFFWLVVQLPVYFLSNRRLPCMAIMCTREMLLYVSWKNRSAVCFWKFRCTRSWFSVEMIICHWHVDYMMIECTGYWL